MYNALKNSLPLEVVGFRPHKTGGLAIKIGSRANIVKVVLGKIKELLGRGKGFSLK
jgi:hypothetical protein